MKNLYFILILGLLSTSLQAQKPKSILKNEIDSVSSAYGVLIGNELRNNGIKVINEKALIQSLKDALNNGKPAMTTDQAILFLTDAKPRWNLSNGNKFLAENKKKDSVVTTASGLQYKIIKPGAGESPKIDSKVTVDYEGTLIDGRIFDSSIKRGQPAQFPVNGVIKGWTEALMLMKPGAVWKLYIPSDLAYGTTGNRGIEPNSVLIFEVHLISIEK
jgi:FKBP-type peptidyl-prolyl cis-trans isomerase FklB